ncbi:MAG: MarR family transcriptional regulator [Candidatus Eisenbacteria bacterium]|uniref:HTH-type transcriptional regulator n=1 Tax=Eiseniibacteriota bacterium TaxID=2212470 RepID=A0A948W4P3_UNCEI|nr:MarR family transcriptional regulator [Candidatus Eisenbacteria bacterium]MBU1949558.1 MarR family transcriptional regulator [Candidatus Eisenbacteria bacterium]MBU2689559.1 MarR family transcriptional regulator [Candidatus Eisenbacteria bacterium]
MSELSIPAEQFILHWGEMSSRWGINRSMAQIHALLYLAEEPLNAEQIAERLVLARSNVSSSLRELMAWGVIRVVHRLGDRRDFFEAEADAWSLLQAILRQRKQREIDPTREMLRGCIKEHEKERGGDVTSIQRMRELLELLETLVSWYEQMSRLSPSMQRKILRLGQKLA